MRLFVGGTDHIHLLVQRLFVLFDLFVQLGVPRSGIREFLLGVPAQVLRSLFFLLGSLRVLQSLLFFFYHFR